MTAREAFDCSDPQMTTAFYDALIRRGLVGQVAFGLFRAQKRSRRAKSYGKRKFRSNAYDAKAEALRYLNSALERHGLLRWGWGIDERQALHRHVLYVDTPLGQVSFHSEDNYGGPAYDGQWDGAVGASDDRIIRFSQSVHDDPVAPIGDWLLMPFGKFVGSALASIDAGYFSWLSGWEGLSSWPCVREFVEAKVANGSVERREVPKRGEKVTWTSGGINDEFRKDESGVCPFEVAGEAEADSR